MKIAVIGAGLGGMSAAYDLKRAGHEVTIFESADTVGGLAGGLKQPEWHWTVEYFYHHWFATDRHILGLIEELGLQNKVIFIRPKTVVHHNEKFYPLDSPLAALTFPGYKFWDMVRFGFVTVYLRYLAGWRSLERFTADEWMLKYYGERLYRVMFEPLLVGKFGSFYKQVNMAWFCARFKARSTKLGTFEGGFQAFAEVLAEHLRKRGVAIYLSSPVKRIDPLSSGGFNVLHGDEIDRFDRCLVTSSPGILAKMVPALPTAYLKGLLELKNLGAVVLILSLNQQLSKEGYYWYNLPKNAGYPFLALVEHTNFVSPAYFGGEHILYCGDYVETDHEYLQLSKEELLQRFLPSLSRFNPGFKPEWVKKSWLFRTNYAQPVPMVNHSENIPDIRTPIPGLYFASMSQVYPWDRGTNFAVEIARRTACYMLADIPEA